MVLLNKMYIMPRSKIEDKIPDITNLATNTNLNAKIIEVKIKIPSITNLATTDALNAEINEVKNKILNLNNVAATTAFTAVEDKILDHSKYILLQNIIN